MGAENIELQQQLLSVANGLLELKKTIAYAQKAEAVKTSHNSDYTKCADDIMKLSCADGVVNPKGVLISILKRHFA